MNFWKDFSDHGPFLDGRIVETGLVFKGPVRFEPRRNDFGGECQQPIGTFAHATRVTQGKSTTITIDSPWMERT